MKTGMTKLLIVDDIDAYLRSLQRALSHEWAIVCAHSLAEAEQNLEQDTPDVALIDIRLAEDEPGNQDGLILLQRLRASQSRLPIVMMSAYQDASMEEQAMRLGAAAFLKKPIDLRELKALLASLRDSVHRS